MAHIKRISFAHVGRKEGCLCDKCGQYIQNIVTVDFDDSISFNYGQDCFAKLYNSGKLTAYGVKLMKDALKSIEFYSRELAKYVNGEMTEENDKGYQYDQIYGGYWQGKPFEEWRKWKIEEWFPARFEDAQKKIDRFAKVNFDR